MIWKDGTKMDNGICIQTMPTQNYFISLWNMKLTLRIFAYSQIWALRIQRAWSHALRGLRLA